ncbi:MAG TPA: prepilin-type N-terminal cleavage/methylation domain-containing protein [Candidatus Omnitrophota bacterium]|nr:prepilin-type N-terminal cleavage/methylation domain-containing protein [Candidatus Omnitrophota bacterium]
MIFSIRGSERGFTLVEVMITVAVFATGIAMIFRILFDVTVVYRHICNRQAAGFIFDEEVWQLKNKLMTERGKMTGFSSRKNMGDVPVMDVSSKLTRNDIFPDLCEINVKISWKEGRKDITLDRTMGIYSPK